MVFSLSLWWCATFEPADARLDLLRFAVTARRDARPRLRFLSVTGTCYADGGERSKRGRGRTSQQGDRFSTIWLHRATA
jgi:hypothetical protein